MCVQSSQRVWASVHAPQHKAHDVVGDRAAADVDVHLHVIGLCVVSHLEGFADYERFGTHGALHHPRSQCDVRYQFEAGVSKLVGSVDESSE